MGARSPTRPRPTPQQAKSSRTPEVVALSTSPERPGHAKPEEFFRVYGLELCDPG